MENSLSWLLRQQCPEFNKYVLRKGFYAALEKHPNFHLPCESREEAMEKMGKLVEEWKEEFVFHVVLWYPSAFRWNNQEHPPGYVYFGLGNNFNKAKKLLKWARSKSKSCPRPFIQKCANGENPDLPNFLLITTKS